jgi:antitoxin (DNA-binding transcriptional repressor) of toxin-antitoxin stability system
MIDVPESEASERFSELLDAVERGDSFTVIRNGQPVARIEKARQVSSDTLKDAFRRHAADPALAEELRELRSLIATDANQ